MEFSVNQYIVNRLFRLMMRYLSSVCRNLFIFAGEEVDIQVNVICTNSWFFIRNFYNGVKFSSDLIRRFLMRFSLYSL